MTFQYARRRPHLKPISINPFTTDWVLHKGFYVGKENWRLIYWDSEPSTIYEIVDIIKTGHSTLGGLAFKVRSYLDHKIYDFPIYPASAKWVGSRKLVTEEELNYYKDFI